MLSLTTHLPSQVKLGIPIKLSSAVFKCTASSKSLVFKSPFHIFATPVCKGRSIQFLKGHFNTKITSVGKSFGNLRYGEDDPFWLSWYKEVTRALKCVLLFIIEQPGQLKHIEWPSFKSTVKTAALTLVLVALLIVALSSLDSALYYLLSLLLRQTAR